MLLSGKAEEIGHPSGSLTLSDVDGKELAQEADSASSQQAALATLSRLLAEHSDEPVKAVGHRIVHGGPHLRQHCALTAEVLATLESSVHFAPLHIPPAVALVRATEKQFPDARQFACFDTQFHTTMPPEAYTYAIPEPYRRAGVQRYGFHGLSYESIVRLLGDDLPAKTVVAHLGSGSSLCALAAGRSVDTSMGASPCGGVPMATRSGDLDPGVGLLLERSLGPELPGLSPDALEDLLNRQSGFQAIAGTSDARALTERAANGDGAAELALNLFARAIAKTVAAYATVLDGLDLLVFTGGIGEHSGPIRRRVCERLAWLGVRLDDASEDAKVPATISTADSLVRVFVQPTDEDGQIALHVSRMMQA